MENTRVPISKEKGFFQRDADAFRKVGNALTPSEFLVWCMIGSYSPYFNPTHENICKDTGLSDSTVKTCISGLEQKRYAIVLKRRLESSTSVRRGGTFEYKYKTFDTPEICLRWVRDEMAPEGNFYPLVTCYNNGWRFASPKNWEGYMTRG